ncbi:MAG: serine/threonine protein phosphatase [Candidatus Diapherotrites archaeon]|nr:serine/threonine protein phosphatase [Candidatus Diapherotrites archaeon]
MLKSRLVEINAGKRAVFVGDTHGDVEASKEVFSRFLDKDTNIILLGDYVDRGEFSRENLDYLLEMKEKHPDNVFLLMGNHEAHSIKPFSPDEFWASLSKEEYKYYSSLLLSLPLVAVAKNCIIALHGSLPNIKSVREIERIALGSDDWKAITWGDFEFDEELKGIHLCSGRPKYSKEHFDKVMLSCKMNLLIRAHQPNAPLFGYNMRCITLFTSKYYPLPRRVAVVDLNKEIKDARDVKILSF